MINWVKETESNLREYPKKKYFLENALERILTLQADYESLKGSVTDTDPVAGGVSHMEYNMLNNIVLRGKLEHNKKAAQEFITRIDKGLAMLTDIQREFLNEFYMTGNRKHVERLYEKYNYEKTRIYEIKTIALRDLTIALYGTIES